MTTLHLRNSVSRSPWRGGFLLIPLMLVCFALLPSAQALTTDPDETFPNFTTAAGLQALLNLTTGSSNTAYGARALRANTTGGSNVGIGGFALINNIDGDMNTSVGNNAMFSNQHGDSNMALGQGALGSNVSGSRNVAMGAQALAGNTASANTAVGFQSLASNATADGNVAVGFQALLSNTTGGDNTAVGSSALNKNTSGGNTAVGFQAGFGLTSGEGNTAMGFQALFSGGGEDNTAIGNSALLFNTTDGNDNVALGAFSGGTVSTADNVICIGDSVVGENTSNRTYIGNIGTFTQAFSVGVNELVTVNLTTGRLGHFNPIPVSSRRYKEDIKPLDKTSEALFSLKPVSYRLKKEFDPTQPLAFGLIAEEVEKVNPDLVYRNNKGQVESVRYEMVNAMVLNEFLKEHQTVKALKSTVEKQEALIAQQQKGMEDLTAQLKEQAAQIQKVSAQLEASKPAPQVVKNP